MFLFAESLAFIVNMNEKRSFLPNSLLVLVSTGSFVLKSQLGALLLTGRLYFCG